MARRMVQHAEFTYTIADDDPAPAELLPWAVLRTRVVDELTLAPPIAPISLTSTLRGARPRVADGGICGLVARPVDVSPALAAPNGFSAHVTAPGYLPRDLTPAIEVARRRLNSPAISGDTSLDVVPGDPAPRAQFRPGRGVLLERPNPADPEQFTSVTATAVAPAATDVPIRDEVGTPRPANAHVVGVPLALPDQPLHRDAAVRLRGRAQIGSGTTPLVPAGGASVGIRGVWWDYPSVVPGAPLGPDLCAIAPTMRLAHPVGAQVHRCTLSPTGLLTLSVFAPPASLQLVLAPNALLNPLGGDLLQVGDPVTADDEVVVTAGFVAPANPAAPVIVNLRTPTGLIHRAGAPVQAVQAATGPLVGAISREGLPGDQVLFAPGLSALPTVSMIVVEKGTPRAVFYRATQLPSTTNGTVFKHLVPVDATGRFEWPPIARIAQIRVVARLAPHPTVTIDMALDYGGDPTLAIVLT